MKHRMLPLTLLFLFSLPLAVIAQSPRYARVISENANLREAPSIVATSQQEIPEGTLVKILDEKGPWYVVRVRDSVGWMHGNTIEFIGIHDSVIQTPRQQTLAPTDNTTAAPVYRPSTSFPRTSAADRVYITGPRGGCYYISGSGRKVYVDRSMCN